MKYKSLIKDAENEDIYVSGEQGSTQGYFVSLGELKHFKSLKNKVNLLEDVLKTAMLVFPEQKLYAVKLDENDYIIGSSKIDGIINRLPNDWNNHCYKYKNGSVELDTNKLNEMEEM